jgi:hypothetical protein
VSEALTAPQRRAIALMRECAGHDDGWAVICSNSDVPSFKADGQAWIHWRTAEALIYKDVVEHDEDYGLIRLWEHSDESVAPPASEEGDG